MIDTSGYRRFERVDEVEETARGIEAALHGERLRVDVVRDDVVRFKISRGGAFDETPTFALCVDPTAEPAEFTVERGEGVARRAHRRARRHASASTRSGSTSTGPTAAPVIETADDPDGRSQAYVTRNDAWALRRRCRPEDAIYGLGEKAGTHNRKGRDFTLWNTDVLDDARDRGVHRGPGRRRPARRPDERRVRPVLRLHPLLPPPRAAVRRRRLVVRRQRPPRVLRLHGLRRVRHPLRGRPVHGVRLRRPGPPGDPRGVHVAHRADGAAAAVGARLPPVPLVHVHAGRGRGARRAATASADLPCDVLWLDIDYMDGYRVFTWDRGGVPRPAGDARAAPRAGLPRDHDRRPGREGRARLRGLRPRRSSATSSAAPRAATSTSARSGRATRRSPTSSRRRRARGGASSTPPTCSRASPGIWNDMNEPATGVDPAGPDALRPRPRTRTSASTTSTRC